MSEIREINWKDVNFDEIPPQDLSFGWEGGRGYYVIIWEMGPNTRYIVGKSYVPESLASAIAGYVRNINS